MYVLRISVLTVVVALCVQCSQTQDTSECPYTYQKQPLPSLECNPYPNSKLILNCVVRGPPQMAIRIVWYWEPINTRQPQRLSALRDKYSLEPRDLLGTTNFRAHQSQLRVQQLNDSDAGWYYCQGNLSNGTLLTPSNRLFLATESAYTISRVRNFTCPDKPQTTTVYSCANTTTYTSTASTTVPTLATDTNIGTGPSSSSPPDDTYSPSLPTTVTLAPTATATPTPESSMFRVALYAVISVIVVFCAVIVTLAVTIVILYRRKGGHTNFKKTADQDQGMNPYSGGFSPDGTRSPAGVALNKTPTASTSAQSSDTPQDQVYSQLAHSTSHPPPPPPLPDSHPVNQYSKLERQHHSETPPPRPPKPPALRTSSNPIVPTTTGAPSRQLSRLYADPETQSHTEWHHNTVPSANIYHTMDDSRQKTVQSHFYHEVEEQKNGNATGEYSYAQTGRLLTTAKPVQEQNEKSHTQRSLFDDPDYSSVELPQTKDVQMIDPRYVGNYERDPLYMPPTVRVPASELDPKYRGDYERDPRYIPKPPPRRNSCESRPPRPPQRRQSLEGDALTRYMGDYEQDPNYIPPPLRNGNMRKGLDKLDRKYHGDYERDPTYVLQKVRKASQKGKVTSAEYSYPYPPTEAISSEELVPPHIPHEYKALEEVLLDPKQEYARLNSEPPENTLP